MNTPAPAHSTGPFYIVQGTVIASRLDEDGDPDCDDDRRNWVGEFYGAKAAADADFAMRAMNSHDRLIHATTVLLRMAQGGTYTAEERAAVISEAEAILIVARGHA